MHIILIKAGYRLKFEYNIFFIRKSIHLITSGKDALPNNDKDNLQTERTELIAKA